MRLAPNSQGRALAALATDLVEERVGLRRQGRRALAHVLAEDLSADLLGDGARFESRLFLAQLCKAYGEVVVIVALIDIGRRQASMNSTLDEIEEHLHMSDPAVSERSL